MELWERENGTIDIQDNSGNIIFRDVASAELARAYAFAMDCASFRRCPFPINGDDGSEAQCIANGHCGCGAEIIPSISS
jgi:hypothetical protein